VFHNSQISSLIQDTKIIKYQRKKIFWIKIFLECWKLTNFLFVCSNCSAGLFSRIHHDYKQLTYIDNFQVKLKKQSYKFYLSKVAHDVHMYLKVWPFIFFSWLFKKIYTTKSNRSKVSIFKRVIVFSTQVGASCYAT